MTIRKITALHDARLTGIIYLENREIRLNFTKADSSRSTLRLEAVESFFCTGMLAGNIVLSIEILDGEDISADDLSYFVAKEDRGQKVPHLQKLIEEKGLCLLLLSPSYGAELACISASVSEQ